MSSSASKADQASAPDLAFVSVTHPDQLKDRSRQRKVRRHVMKDIGFARRRKLHQDQTVLVSPSKISTLSYPGFDSVLGPQQSDKSHAYHLGYYPQQSPEYPSSRPYIHTLSSPYSDRPLYSQMVSFRAQSLLGFRMKTVTLKSTSID